MRILSLLRQSLSQSVDLLPTERFRLEYPHSQDYLEHPVQGYFETSQLSGRKKRVDEPPSSIPSILHFFLDGSRRTYQIADLIIDGHYLPLIAGQIGVAVIARDPQTSHCVPLRQFCAFHNLLAFPDHISLEDCATLEKDISAHCKCDVKIVRYSVLPDRDPVDLGLAKIMSELHELEIRTVYKIADSGMLSHDKLLVIDGALRFKKKIDLIQFRNVIGISKTFRPSFTIGKGAKRLDVGTLTSGLEFGERTSVFRADDEQYTIGMWYLRLRYREQMYTPLQGVVKVECFATTEEEIRNGLDTDRVDTISSHILRERNVTPYGLDYRWASHLYPVFLAESFVKASFKSDWAFQALF